METKKCLKNITDNVPSAYQLPAGLVTFSEEILNGKLHFLWIDC